MKNLSLRARVRASFIIADAVILILMFVVFNYLETLNKKIQLTSNRSNRMNLLTDEVRISAVSILKNQRRFLSKRPTQAEVNKLINLCESFTTQLHSLDSLYSGTEVKKVVAQMLTYVDSLKLLLSKAAFFSRDKGGMQTIAGLADKILDSFSDFQYIQYDQSAKNEGAMKKIIKETKRQMMIVLILGFLFTIILALVIPGQIALPFKKIKDAIRELQSCNFDVSIYYRQKDEIGELATEMNKMIHNLKIFEELRIDRIAIENRKFDTLANIIKKPLLLTNAENEAVYMNNKLYSILQLQSEDVIGKEITENVISKSIVDAMNLAIKRRSKIENSPISIKRRKILDEITNDSSQEDGIDDDENDGIERAVTKYEEELVYEGYANVIPIRGKESSLDYYLMVISKEVFA